MGFISWIKRKILRNAAARWDHQYAAGKWEMLKQEEEKQRLELALYFLKKYSAQPRVLEIGCGEGDFSVLLKAGDYLTYTGIDVSELALRKAREKAGHNMQFISIDMDRMKTTAQYDVVLFNEVINYSRDIPTLLKKLKAQSLAPYGVVIISVFDHKYSDAIWEKIECILKPVEEAEVTGAKGKWKLKVMK